MRLTFNQLETIYSAIDTEEFVEIISKVENDLSEVRVTEFDPDGSEINFFIVSVDGALIEERNKR